MRSFSEFIGEQVAIEDSSKSDLDYKLPFEMVASGSNHKIQAKHKNLTIVRDMHRPHEYTTYNVHAHHNPNNQYVGHYIKPDSRIEHYHYPNNNNKPSYISDKKHNDLLTKGRYVVKEFPRSLLQQPKEHHHKTAASALAHAKQLADRTMARKISDAVGAGATYSHRHFSQKGNS